MIYIIGNKIYNIIGDSIYYEHRKIYTVKQVTVGSSIIKAVTHNRYYIFILTAAGIYTVDHTFNERAKPYAIQNASQYIGCNSRDIYYTYNNELYKISIAIIFNCNNGMNKIFETPSTIIGLYIGEYYQAIITHDKAAYICGMNSFMQFGENMTELMYPLFVRPRGLKGTPVFSTKSTAYFTQNSIQIYGKYSCTIIIQDIITHVNICNNILVYAAAALQNNIKYYISIYDLSTNNCVETVSLSEEQFLIGIRELYIIHDTVYIIFNDNTVLHVGQQTGQQTAGQQTGQQTAGQQTAGQQTAGQQTARLISTGSTAYHTIYNTATGLIQTGRCAKQGHIIIQNTQLIKKILTNTTHTLFLFHTGIVYIMNNMDGDIEQLIFNEPIVDVSLGRQHMLFVGVSGTVHCTGDNSFGQLGIATYSGIVDSILTLPSTAFEQKAEAIFASLGIIKETLGPDAFIIERVYAGIDTSFFIARDGSIYCCGNNSYGQLGIGTKNTRNVPVRMTRFCSVIALSGESVSDIQFTANATLFLQSTGRIMTAGQLPACDNPCLFPCLLPAAVQPAERCLHSAAITSSSEKVACQISTGINHYVLRFTDNSTISSNNVEKSDVSHVICGAYHTIYLFNNGTVETEGQNGYGQLNISQQIL